MECLILGGGLAGLSLALFLQNSKQIDKITILEKNSEYGGLCRSFQYDGRKLDIGPHIIFSRDSELLNFMSGLLGDNQERHRRNNAIPHKGNWVRYPFENNLSALSKNDCEYCLKTFLDNPYREFAADNMLQFFLKTFGEGITNLYLRPYNEKIWKFDPSFMNTAMVERIPRPPDIDIIKSAKGDASEGHLHQLYFIYPKTGGIAALVQSVVDKFNDKVRVLTNHSVTAIDRIDEHWQTVAGGERFTADLLVSCMPVNEMVSCFNGAENNVRLAARRLRYNHILLSQAKVKIDRIPNIHTLTIADKSVIFHRLSKTDYMGGEYGCDDAVTYVMEYTYPDGDDVAILPSNILRSRFIDGLKIIGLIENEEEVVNFETRHFPYAYVVYDLMHSENMKILRDYFHKREVFLHGRFGNFEYWNMDRVIRESRGLAERIERYLGR